MNNENNGFAVVVRNLISPSRRKKKATQKDGTFAHVFWSSALQCMNMDDICQEIRDSLRWLEEEVDRARKHGILGEIVPELAADFRDKQAEEIESVMKQISAMLVQMTSDKPSTLYSWYSPRVILATLFGGDPDVSMKTGMKRRLTMLVNQAAQLTTTTADFRNLYEHIYRAALYGVLPQGIVNHQIRIQNNGLKYNGVWSVIGIGLRVEQSPHALFSYMCLDLDTAHQLDRTLVTLSMELAYLLEISWGGRYAIPAETAEIIQHAGDVFQRLLVISQGNTLVRMSVSGLLNDVSRIMISLKEMVDFDNSTAAFPFNTQGKTTAEKALKFQKEVTESHEARQRMWKAIKKLSLQVKQLAEQAANTSTSSDEPEILDHEFEESAMCLSSRELTFGSTTQWMDENCPFEKMYDRPEKQEFKSGVEVRSGSYADVYRVGLREIREVVVNFCPEPDTKIRMHWEVDEVAVKVLKCSRFSERTVALRALREFVVWSKMQHPNIVPLMGLWFGFGPGSELPAFVSPWLKYGSLFSYLENKSDLRRKRRLNLLYDVAKALAYMHNHHPSVCHGDINPDNILVIDGRAFVCDFGVSYISAPYEDLTTGTHGDWRYKAPEHLIGNLVMRPTPQSDMYSFGLLCYMVLTGHHPWPGMARGHRIEKPYLVPSRPSTMGTGDYELLRYCWKRDARLRATANIAVMELKGLIDSISKTRS